MNTNNTPHHVSSTHLNNKQNTLPAETHLTCIKLAVMLPL